MLHGTPLEVEEGGTSGGPLRRLEMLEVTWTEFKEMCITLARMLEGKVIWGVPRGGGIVEGVMCYYGCRNVTGGDEPLVIVDDIADGGDTLKFYREKGHVTAALLVRYNCFPKPDAFIRIIDTDDYMLFPYEDPQAVAERLKKGGTFRNGQ